MKKEIWKPVVGYEGYYEVSSLGRVRSIERDIEYISTKGLRHNRRFKSKMLKPHLRMYKGNPNPRATVVLTIKQNKSTKTVARLVAKSFLGVPGDGYEVNHKDGDSSNDEADNLEWVTAKENIRHAFNNKLIRTEKPVIQICRHTGVELKEFKSESEACRCMGVTQGKILRAMQRDGTSAGFKWKYK